MTNLIHCQAITKIFGQTVALDKLTCTFEKGKITAILGRNGSGKTTLIKILLQMILPEQGQVLYRGIPAQQIKHHLYHHTAAILESVDNLYDHLTGRQNLAYFLGLQGKSGAVHTARAKQLLDQFSLTATLDKPCGSYSRGMKQKLSLSIALLSEADILFLDEPTLGLDFESEQVITDTIKELAKKQGKTIILTSHQADLIDEVADNILLINKGKLLFSGSLEEFKTTKQNHQHFIITCKPGDYESDGATFRDGNYIFQLNSQEEMTNFLQGHPELLPYLLSISPEETSIDQVLTKFYEEVKDDKTSH